MNNSKLKKLGAGLLFLALATCYVWLQLRNDRQNVYQSRDQLEAPGQLPLSPKSTLPGLAHLTEGIESHRKAQEKLAKVLDAEEAENRRMKRWKENFPYKPTHHPTLTYDPARYNPNDPATFSEDPEMERAVKNHGFLVAFYNNPQIYSSEFEQLYHLLAEVDRADNPMITGRIFNMLIHYYKSQRFAPTDLWSRPGLIQAEAINGSAQRMVEARIPIDGKTTWGDKMEGYRDSIVGLLALNKYWPGKEEMSPKTARAIRDRLLEEIGPDNLIKMRDVVELPNGQIGAFGYYGEAEKALKPGDPLLYR